LEFSYGNLEFMWVL